MVTTALIATTLLLAVYSAYRLGRTTEAKRYKTVSAVDWDNVPEGSVVYCEIMTAERYREAVEAAYGNKAGGG